MARAVDPRAGEKENRIKELCVSLRAAGVVVRREELKRGHGWRAVSGNCRLKQEPIVFVDRRSSLEEQLAFLESQARVFLNAA